MSDVHYLVVNEPDTGLIYNVSLDEIREKELAGELKTINYTDEQIVLMEGWFEKRQSPQGRLF